MPVYIALLRGINVGGKNKIKMSELRTALQSIGLERVETYIASGNVLFEAEEAEEPLRRKMEEGIERTFGISLTVVLRTADELERIIRENPFPEASIPDEGSLQLSLMTVPPTEQQLQKILAGKSDRDDLQVIGRELYSRLGQSILDSKLMGNLGKLKDTVTTRNWNTVKKLAELAEARRG